MIGVDAYVSGYTEPTMGSIDRLRGTERARRALASARLGRRNSPVPGEPLPLENAVAGLLRDRPHPAPRTVAVLLPIRQTALAHPTIAGRP